MAYTVPETIWQVNSELRFDEPLDGPTDPRWVDTAAARGPYSIERFYRLFGVQQGELHEAPKQAYHLFYGHRGCGKSTELRRIRHDLHKPELFYVLLIDVASELDVNNLRYQDVLLHLASKLIAQLSSDGVAIEDVHLQRLLEWFFDRIESRAETRSFALELKAGSDVKLGLPLLGRLFGGISTALKNNSSHKDELRRTTQNYFSDFSAAFNLLIEAAKEGLRTARLGNEILFIVDGTDRLREDDARSFFVSDVHQLQQVRGLFVYCAPIHLSYEGPAVHDNFDSTFRLPMVKTENVDGSRNDPGFKAMRHVLERRASPSLFDSTDTADYLIEHSGGHPRDLLRLLQQAFSYAAGDVFTMEAAVQAVKSLSSDFARLLTQEDVRLIARIDRGAEPFGEDSERARSLLYNLALLEYNDFFWRSHPVVRIMPEYLRALENAGLTKGAGEVGSTAP